MTCYKSSGVNTVSMSGITYDIDNNQKPILIISNQIIDRQNYLSFTLEFLIYGLENVEDLKNNTGAEVTFYNRDTLTITEPFDFGPGSLTSSKTNTWKVTLKSQRPTRNYVNTEHVVPPPTPTTIKNGYLYNWFVIDGNETNLLNELRVPSDTDWSTYETYAATDVGGKLKETGTANWTAPNTGATDIYNFTALPSGSRNGTTGVFTGMGTVVNFWSSTEVIPTNAKYRFIVNNSAIMLSGSPLQDFGYSIRCMRDLTAKEQIDYADGEVVELTTDKNGNVYQVIRIGTQGWTDRNIIATSLLDGTVLTKVTDGGIWTAATSGDMYYCAYDNDDNNV